MIIYRMMTNLSSLSVPIDKRSRHWRINTWWLKIILITRGVPGLGGTLYTVLLQNSNKYRLYSFSIDTILLYMYVFCFDICNLFLIPNINVVIVV